MCPTLRLPEVPLIHASISWTPIALAHMNDPFAQSSASPKFLLSSIWRDIQFWVPLVVLLIGLTILYWVE
jgi:hypothetical protein